MLRSFFLFSIFTKILSYIRGNSFGKPFNFAEKFKTVNKVIMIYFAFVLLMKFPWIMVPVLSVIGFGIYHFRKK